MVLWWYSDGVAQAGPVSLEALQRLIREGTVGPEYLVWNNQLTDWVFVVEVESLANCLPKTQLIPSTQASLSTNRALAPGSNQLHSQSTLMQPQRVEIANTRRSPTQNLSARRKRSQAVATGIQLCRLGLIAVLLTTIMPWLSIHSFGRVDLPSANAQIDVDVPGVSFSGASMNAMHGRMNVQTPGGFSQTSMSLNFVGYLVPWVNLAAVLAMAGLILSFLQANSARSNSLLMLAIISTCCLGACVLAAFFYNGLYMQGGYQFGTVSGGVTNTLAIGAYVGLAGAGMAALSAFSAWHAIAGVHTRYDG